VRIPLEMKENNIMYACVCLQKITFNCPAAAIIADILFAHFVNVMCVVVKKKSSSDKEQL
jgi:hypothetical protein